MSRAKITALRPGGAWTPCSAPLHPPAQGEDGRGEEGGEREQPSQAVRGEQGGLRGGCPCPGHSFLSPCALLQAAVQRAEHLEALLEQQRQQLLAAK